MDKRINAKEVWVVIPSYNEETVIGNVLKGVIKVCPNVIVVDDGSSDKTAQKVLDFPVTLLRHTLNLGQGAALQTGIDYALTQPVGYLVTFDADGQHLPEEIPQMVKICQQGGCDVVLGSRFASGGKAISISPGRRFLLKMATLFTQWSTGLKVTDTHNGFRVFSRKAAEQIHINHNGMAHASEILSQIARMKFKYTEVPVTIRYTAYSKKKGQSFLNAINILWDIWTARLK